jgi:tetratricopeptide (TPR) repeat protein
MNAEHAESIRPARGLRKKRFIVLVFLVIAAVFGSVWLYMRQREPSYNGHPLSYWLEQYNQSGAAWNPDANDPIGIESREAIRHIGTNAIPVLLRMLRTKDSWLKVQLADSLDRQDYVHFRIIPAEMTWGRAALGFACLDDLGTNAVPALIGLYKNSSFGPQRGAIDNILMTLYPARGTAVPYWRPPQGRFGWYFEAGQLKARAGAYSNAVIAFTEAIQIAPTNVEARLNRASAKTGLGEFSGALADLKHVVAVDSSNSPAFHLSGWCRFMTKDFKEADADFTTAINLNTNDVFAYNYRGLARANLRKLDDAIADFNKALEIDPQDETAYRNRSIVEHIQKEYELALADATKAIDLGGKDASAYISRGRSKIALKDYNGAILDFNAAIELNPKDPADWTGRGTARLLMDEFDAADADLAKALELDPKHFPAHIARGLIKMKRGDHEGALADLRHAQELKPESPEIFGMIGLAEYTAAHWDPALANCRKALELGTFANAGELRSYSWLIRAQKGEAVDANRELESYLNSLPNAKTNEWDASIARFFIGSLNESNFLAQATAAARRLSDVKGQVCDSLYYAGMKRKLAGDTHGALELFQKCLDTKYDNSFGWMNAGAELRRSTNN